MVEDPLHFLLLYHPHTKSRPREAAHAGPGDKIVVHAAIPIEMFRNSDGSLRDQEGTDWKKS